MKIKIFKDIDEVALNAAGMIAEEARAAVAERGRFILALSGGRAPRPMFKALACEDFLWSETHLFQVDERIAPEGHPDRNFNLLKEIFADKIPAVMERMRPMPVDTADMELGAATYEAILNGVAGSPPVIDVVHLGLGTDGHTASLVPNDPVLHVTNQDVALTGIYQGRRRMTLTYPVINRARVILWLVTGPEKSEMLLRLSQGDDSIPAGRVRRQMSFVFADKVAAKLLNCGTC